MFQLYHLTYTQAEIQQEEDVERHVNLQREVLVEVLTRLDWAVGGRNNIFKPLTNIERQMWKSLS